MLATLTMLSLVAAHQDEAIRPSTLFQSLEAVADKIPYVDPNAVPSSAKFHEVELRKSAFAFGKDMVVAFRFDAIPDAGRRSLALGWLVKGIKSWGIWSRKGPEDILEQFEEVRSGSGLVVGQSNVGALIGSREYIVWFRVKAGSPTKIPVSLNMYSVPEMQTSVIENASSYSLVNTEQQDADETDPWDAVMTAQTKNPPVATIQPLPALDESHLLFDTKGSTDFGWSPFEFAGRHYVSTTIDLGTGLMDQHLDLYAFGGEYDEWGYDTRAVVTPGIYSWGYRAVVTDLNSKEDTELLASEVLGVRAVVPLRNEKHSGTMVIWFRLKGDKPPSRLLLNYQDPRKRLRDLLGPLPSLG